MNIQKAFEKYSSLGIACLPTKKDKSPDVRGTWKGGIIDPKAYSSAFGIGIICGSISKNIECLDFDNHFGDAKDILSAYLTGEAKEIFKKNNLPIESTTSGGFHLLYRCSKIEGNQKLAQRPKKEADRWRPDTIIETRGEGGYFCVDPTPGYKTIRNDIFSIPEITPDERQVLIEQAKAFNTWSDIRKNEYEEKDRPGDIFNAKPEAIDEMKSALTRAGWKEITHGIWQRPGKNKGISATIGKVAANVFYCFTSNGHPFNENSGYTPFQVISLLNYNGDFKAATKDIAERYSLNSNNKTTSHKSKEKVKQTSAIELDSILKGAYIDLEIPVEKPPVIMKIRDVEGMTTRDKRLFTLGNFSATTGKSKSKKTFLASMLLAAASGNTTVQNKFTSDLPKNKLAVLLFDTEQSRYDSFLTSSRIPSILGYIPENFGAFDLREFTPHERCEIIDFALKKFKDNLGFVVIDGVADLAKAINDEEEATRVVGLLMKWSKLYNCHIHTIIHQNKQDNFATGHLGSAIIKKAETIISVTKDTQNSRTSNVSCQMIRGTDDFDDFDFTINTSGLPEILKEENTYKNIYETEREFF